MARPPVHVIRMGLIKASIWRSQTRVGERHNVTLHRLYKNGEAWKESGQFGRDDLLLAAKVFDWCILGSCRQVEMNTRTGLWRAALGMRRWPAACHRLRPERAPSVGCCLGAGISHPLSVELQSAHGQCCCNRYCQIRN